MARRSYTRPSVNITVIGAAALAEMFNAIIDRGRDAERGKWWVVSMVNYAEFLEFRQPHWRVAIQSVADQFEMDEKEQQKALNAMMAGGNLTRDMAERLSTRIQRLIIQHNLIDTGNYLASIAEGPTLDQAIEQSLANLILPDTAVLVVT